MIESTDPYVYPGTDVLKNLRNIRDAQVLAEFEASNTYSRLRELAAGPITGQFDTPHLKALHKYIFQDVYPWAGEFRTVKHLERRQFLRPS